MVVNIIVWSPEESANNKAFQHANSWTTGLSNLVPRVSHGKMRDPGNEVEGFPVVQFECKIIKK